MTPIDANAILLDHYRRPRGRGELEGATAEATERTPLCGDEVRLMVRVEDDVVAAVRFQGQGCSISQASASLLAEHVPGLTVEAARARVREMKSFLAGERRPDLGDLEALEVARDYPTRRGCALLPWLALEKALAP